MATTKLHYVFPWEPRGTVAGSEGFELLDGAIRGAVRYNAHANPHERYAALLEPALHLGAFATNDEARAAVEHHTADKINAMLGIILPDEVKRWLTRN